MNKKIITFLIIFNLVNCEKIKVDITFNEAPGNKFTFDFIPNESNIGKDFVNQIKNQSSISISFYTVGDETGVNSLIDSLSFPLDNTNDELAQMEIGQFSKKPNGQLDIKVDIFDDSSGYIIGKLKTEDINSLKNYLYNDQYIYFTFYIEYIELKIENCLDTDEDYNNYEMGIIINKEFYSLEHEKNCSWLTKIEKKNDIFTFKTLLFTSVTSNKRPFYKTINLNELDGTGEINECRYKKENYTIILDC